MKIAAPVMQRLRHIHSQILTIEDSQKLQRTKAAKITNIRRNCDQPATMNIITAI